MQREMLLALPEEIIAFLKQRPEYGPKLQAEAAAATIAQIDPAGDATMIEEWFLDGTIGK